MKTLETERDFKELQQLLIERNLDNLIKQHYLGSSFSVARACMDTLNNELIHLPAVPPNLALIASQRPDVGHLDHPHDEVVEEGSGVAGVVLDQGHAVAADGFEELLIGVEETLEGDEVVIVIVVEHCRSLQVQRCQDAVAGANGSGAIRLPHLREGAVDVGVVVDMVSEV